MNKTQRITLTFVVFGLLAFLCNNNIFAQNQNIITLDQPESGNIDNVARHKVRLKPGYQYTPSSGAKMHAYIDELPSEDVDYTTPFTNATFDRDLNTSLDVGTLAGSHSVSSSGAANYSIPIALPPGTNGMVPSLGLVYDSQGPNSGMGMGWSLSGLSSISLIGKTIYHDGEVAPIQKGSEAAYALDGNRLVLAPGSTTVYYTELETFSRITAHGTAGSGPQWFEVETKSGITYEYGRTADARFTEEGGNSVLFWRMNKMYDCYGNYVEYKYTNEDRDSRIDEILYTGNANAGLAPYNKIKFYYDIRSDINTKYICGSTVTSKYLLTYIKVTTENGTLVSAYELDYAYDGVHSLLQEITQHGAEGCEINPTIFKYYNFSSNIQVEPPSIFNNQSVDVFSGDFNGDGVSDILSAEYDTNNNYKTHKNFKIFIRDPLNSTFTETVSQTFPSEEGYEVHGPSQYGRQLFVSDYNGDGKDDIF